MFSGYRRLRFDTPAARLIPQTDVDFGLFYKNVSFVPRRDGLVFQAVGEDDYFGYDDQITIPIVPKRSRPSKQSSDCFHLNEAQRVKC